MFILMTRYYFLVITFVCCFCAVLSINNGSYTIVAPETIQPESPFHVSITLNDFNESCWFSISFTTFMTHTKMYEFESVEVKPGTTKLIELYAPSLDYGLANLEVNGYRGIISKDSALIQFKPEEYWTFIQTNKFKYKPGELVQFRVICIDQLRRPLKLNQNVTIEIYDGQHNMLKKILDVQLVQGVFKGQFQLSNYPVLGIWKIRANGNRIFTEKKFEVDRYILPKFNVKIDANVIATEKNQIELVISANFFQGEPVKGNLSITLINTEVPWHTYIPTLPSITRELKIDGNTTIILDLKNDLQLEYDNKNQITLNAYSIPAESYIFSAVASVIDDLSEEKSWAETELEIYGEPYYIELEAPETFEADEIIKIEVKVSLKNIADNLVKDTSTPIEVIVGCDEVVGYNRNLINFDQVRVEYKNEAGEKLVMVNVTNKNYNECYVYAVYQEIKSQTKRMYKNDKEFKMEILTESPEVGKVLQIQITNSAPFEEFSYEIVSRGDIIQSDRLFVTGNQKIYILCINVTSLMVPRITIYAHHIKNMKFSGQLNDVVVKRAHQNSIKITTNYQTTPGSPVTINVTTDEGSYVGLMGLDRSTLHNVEEKDIFDEDSVNTKLKRVNSVQSYPTPFYGRTGSLITFSNVFPPGIENVALGDLPLLQLPERNRKLLPESWLYADFERTPAGGFSFMETTPNTITTWALTGFSLHPDTGLTFTKISTGLEVFQQIFVSFDLPNLVTEGEIIEVPIYISNYMNQDALTNVTIDTNSEDLEILDNPQATAQPKLYFSKIISSKKREKILVFLKPLQKGSYNVTVKARSSVASDIAQKTLIVQPQGISFAMSKSYLVHLLEENIQEDEISIEIPENAVPGSQTVEVSVVGDIFQPLIRNLQKLARDPCENGEDNMKLIVANSIVLKYFKTLDISNPSLESEEELNLELGYQNQLSFKYNDDSFGLFERKLEASGDIWQTAFALWGLKKANEFILVDTKVTTNGLYFLKSKQQENGCFKSKSGLEGNIKSTAFALMVFLMDENFKTTYSETIVKGLACLYEISSKLENTPSSFLTAYVLKLGRHEKAEDFLRNLPSKAHLTSKQKAWTTSDSIQSHLEATTGSMMSILEFQEVSDQSLLQICRGLISSKNEESFVFHMIALETMIELFEKSSLLRTNLKLRFKDDQHKSGDFRINNNNSQSFQTFELAQNSRKIKLQSRGQGFAMVDVQYEYSISFPENQSSSLHSIGISTEKYSNLLTDLTICSNVLSNNTREEFIVMEINLQSGYTFSEGDMNEIESFSEVIRSLQFNDSRNKGKVYFDANDETCITLEVRKNYKVFNLKPGWVILNGARDKDQKTAKSFLLNNS